MDLGPGPWGCDPLSQVRVVPRALVHTLSGNLPSPPQLSLLSQLLSLMRPSSLRQCLGAETLPSCPGQQPKASAELDHKVSTPVPACLHQQPATQLAGRVGLSPWHSLQDLWLLALPEPQATQGQRPAGCLLCGEEALSIPPKPLIITRAHLCV